MNGGSNDVTVAAPLNDTIDGSATYILSAIYKYVKVVSDGKYWAIVGNN